MQMYAYSKQCTFFVRSKALQCTQHPWWTCSHRTEVTIFQRHNSQYWRLEFCNMERRCYGMFLWNQQTWAQVSQIHAWHKVIILCLFNSEWTTPPVMLLSQKIYSGTLVLIKSRSFLHWKRRWKYWHLGPIGENSRSISDSECLYCSHHQHQTLDLLLWVSLLCSFFNGTILRSMNLNMQGELLICWTSS